MTENQAKVKFYQNKFEVIKNVDHVVCAVSGKNIPLNELFYWNVDLQEAYFSPKEVKIRYQQINKEG